MNRSILIVVVACTIFASATAKISLQKLEEAENQIKVCFDEVIEYKMTGDAKNKTCKNINHFDKQFKKFADVYQQHNNYTYAGNQKYIGIWRFLLRHKNTKDYINNLSCMNQTSCVSEVYGVAVEDKTISNTTGIDVLPTDTNLVSVLYDPAKKTQYHFMMCDKIESLAKCLEAQEFSKCGNSTAKFYVDFYAYQLEDCRNHTAPSRSALDGSASGLTPVTFLVSIIVTVMFLLR